MSVTGCWSFAIFNIGVVVLIVCFFAIRLLDRAPSFFDIFLDITLLAHYGAAILSAVHSTDPAMSLQGLQKLGRYLLLFITVREFITTEKTVKTITLLLITGGTVASLDAVSQYVFGQDFLMCRTPFLSMTDLIRLSGPFSNPNAFAIYLSFLIPLTGALLLARKKHSLWLSVPLSLMLFSVVMTFSRPAAIGIAFAGLLIILMKRLYWVIPAVLVMMIPAAFFLPAEVKIWLSNLGTWKSFFYDISRNFHHLAAWNMIHAHPWFGVGVNTFDVNYNHFKASGDTVTRWSAHQTYLQIWAEMGLAGLLTFFMILAGIFSLSIKSYRGCKDLLVKQILVGFMGGAVAFLIIGCFESDLWQPRQTYFFWFFTGILCGIAKWVKMQNELR